MREQRDTVVRKPLYPYVAHHAASSGTYTAVHAVQLFHCGKSFQLFSPLSGCCCFSRAPTTAAVKKARLPRYNSHASSVTLCDSHERCFSVWVRERAYTCVKCEQRHTYCCCCCPQTYTPYVALHGQILVHVLQNEETSAVRSRISSKLIFMYN